MNDEARAALGRVIRAYGPAIGTTPRSCGLFVRQECGSYPDECRVLVEALRQGAVEEIIRFRADRPWDEFTAGLVGWLPARAAVEPEQAAWAVDAWAKALGK